MNALINPSKIGGKICSIPSKSYAHRILICSAFSNAPTDIVMDINFSKDIEATAKCLENLGCKICKKDDNCITVFPAKQISVAPVLDCFESGSTLRFLLPVVATLGNNSTFIGSGKLPDRPISMLLNQLENHAVSFSSSSLPLTVKGKMNGGVFSISGDVSSQFVTGLLLALPLTKEGGEIKLTSPLESKSYVDITIEVMKSFGVDVEITPSGYIVPPNSKYISPQKIAVQGDWSNSAFWLCSGAISDEIVCTGLDLKSSQGDKAILEILKLYGAKVETHNNTVKVSPNNQNPFNFDAQNVPDLVPVVSVIASIANGVTTITNTQRLRIKECDRIEATINLLQSLGSNASYRDGVLKIFGNGKLDGGKVCGYNDHRIVMSAAVASTVCSSSVTISDANAVLKSYPNFFEDFKKLGGNANVI